jgi:hypothetical protein
VHSHTERGSHHHQQQQQQKQKYDDWNSGFLMLPTKLTHRQWHNREFCVVRWLSTKSTFYKWKPRLPTYLPTSHPKNRAQHWMVKGFVSPFVLCNEISFSGMMTMMMITVG